MATATTPLPADRHSWLDTFVADPVSELDNLLSGHARIEPYESADAPDAARLLFGGQPEGGEALAVLDRAVRDWLDSQRLGGVPELEQLPLERWIRKVSEAFEIVALLKLRHTALDLRQRFVLWNSWCDRLAVSAQRDGRYAFLRTLALTQRIAADADPAANPFALEPLWLRVCEHAGVAFPKHFLGIGLLGLRMLPEREDAPSERPWMAGLVYWAIGQKPTAGEFSQQWWALKGLYPRMPSYWRSALRETLRQSLAKGIPDEIKDWWSQDVRAKDNRTAPQPASPATGVPILSPLSAVNLLRQRAGNRLPSIRVEINTLVGERRHFAEVTGESYYLVTTACNLGMAIIKGADDPVGRGRFSVDLARQALAWQPANVYAWALWRDALARQGAFEAAELVGWESIHRFPENVQWRTQLALLLADLPGREAEAEDLLRETMERFPDNVIARTQLALLLADLPGREAEAEHLLRETMKRFPDNVIARNQLALLLADLPGREAEAEDLLRETMERFPDNVIARNQLAELLISLDRTSEATGIVDDTFSRKLEDEAAFDLRARLLSHDGDFDAAKDVLGSAVKRFRTNPILRTHLTMLEEGKALPLKAVAFRRYDTTLPEPSAVDTEVAADTTVRQRGRLRRLSYQSRRRHGDGEWRGRALEEVRRALSENPNLAYAQYLSRELEGGDGIGSAAGSFAIAFIDALKRKDANRLSALEESFSGQTQFVDVAKVFLFGDRSAADRTVAWLTHEIRSEPRTVSALRGFLKQRIDIASVGSGDAFVKLVASNDNIQTDLIESVLAGDELLLVA